MTIILILDSLGFSLTRHNVSGETRICESMQHREERLVYPPATAYTALQLQLVAICTRLRIMRPWTTNCISRILSFILPGLL